MTSAAASTVGRRRNGAAFRPSGWSLRTRLVAALVGLLALVCLVVGVATELSLQHFLLGRLDTQLTAAGNRSAGAVGADMFSGPGDGGGDRPGGGGYPGADRGVGFLLAPGQMPRTVGARIVAGQVTAAGVLSEGGAVQDLTAAEQAAVAAVPVDRRPHSRRIGARGDYRLLAARDTDGDVYVTGLPLSEVTATLYRLMAVEIAVAGLGLLVAALAGAAIIRRALRPLRRVAATAGRVSTLPLDRGEVALAERVPVSDTDPRTEVGQVGAALNRLLGHVGAALTAR
jgi:two-component system OmpR family sensor kinase